MSRYSKPSADLRKLRRQGRDQIPSVVSLKGTHLANPKKWFTLEIQRIAKSVVRVGDFLTLQSLAERISKAVCSIIRNWTQPQYEIVRRLSRVSDQFDFGDRLDQNFLNKIVFISNKQTLSDAQKGICLLLCREVFDWTVRHPITPLLKEKEDEQTT